MYGVSFHELVHVCIFVVLYGCRWGECMYLVEGYAWDRARGYLVACGGEACV